MNTIYLEHANITVNNLDQAIKFFKTAFPAFRIRGKGEFMGRKWIHLGTEETYLAINEATLPTNEKNMNRSGFNHLGFVVDNVKEVAERLLKAGFKRDYEKQVEEFRIRDYFADDDGNEYEFVQYLSEDPQERNKY